MTAAEKGKASTPLDKSSPQAPVTDEDTVFDASVPEASSSGDDESGNTADMAEQRPPQRPRDRRDFFDWLFGRAPPPPPPPPPPSVAQPANPDADDDSN